MWSCGASQGTALGQRALSQRFSCYAATFLIKSVRYPFIKYFGNTGSLLLLFHSLLIFFLNTDMKTWVHFFQSLFSGQRTTRMALNFNFIRDGSVPQRPKSAEVSRANLSWKALLPCECQANFELATWLLKQCSCLYCQQASKNQHVSTLFFPAPQPSEEPLHQSEKYGFLCDETVAVNCINLQICTVDLEQNSRTLFHSDLKPQDAMLVNTAQ